MSRLASALRGAAALVSPRHRRWRRLLRSCQLDPGQMDPPLDAPGPCDFIVCGSPRTGTALVTAELFQPPDIVTVMEPWDGLRLPPADLFGSLREEIQATGRLSRGRLDLKSLLQAGEVRWCRDGERPHPVKVSPNHHLGVKWPTFWQYLDLLPDTRFVVCLRDPREVVASYRRSGGWVARGLDYPVAFNRRMNEYLASASDDDALRRVLLFDYIHQRILPHLDRPNVLPLRYERWFTQPKQVMRELGEFLGLGLDRLPVSIRPPRPPDLSPRELDLLRRHCSTAGPLGYEL